MAEVLQLGRHLSVGAAAPDVADVRRLLQQVEQHEHALSTTSMIAALDGASLADVAQARARAKADFSRLKLNLLEQETKKRLLEQLLSNGTAPTLEVEALAENQMHERKSAAKQAKGESKALADRLIELASSIADIKRALHDEGAALLALVSSRETDEQREVAAKAQLLNHEQAVERLERARESEEAAAAAAEAELEQLRAQAQREEARRAQVEARIDTLREEARKAEQHLQAAMEQQATATQASADAARHAHVMESLGALGGVRLVEWRGRSACADHAAKSGAAAGGSVLTLELRTPNAAAAWPVEAGRAHPSEHVLTVAFDEDGALHGDAELSPPSVPIADLLAAATRANALPMFVRELLARLGSGAAGAALEVAPVELPVRKPSRSAAAVDHNAERAQVDATSVQPACAPGSAAQPPARVPASPSSVAAACPLTASPAAAQPATPAAPPSGAPSASAPPSHGEYASASGVALAAAAAIDAVLPAEQRIQPPHTTVPAARVSLAGPPAASPATPAAPPAAPDGAKRKSGARKSFSRKSLDAGELKRALGPAHSPCGRAEKAGSMANPRAAILGLQGDEPIRTELTLRSTDGAEFARVLSDGTVLHADGSLLGYIEADGTVGSATMELLGEVNSSTGWISDADELPIAMLDLGRVAVKDTSGSTIAEFDSAGVVKGHRGMACGRVEGFTYAHMHIAAALVTLVCPDFVRGA